MDTRRARCAAFLTALIACSPLALAGAAAPTVVLRVPAKAWPLVAAAQVEASTDLDYGSFHWLEVADTDLARLDARGVPYTVVADARQVRVPGYRFDPLRDGEPQVPDHLRADESSPGFRLVQLAGPAKDGWLERIAAAGLRVLQYYPHNTYLVWGAQAASQDVESLEFVRWQGLFHPAYKINADLQGRSGKISNVDVVFFNDGDRESTLAALARFGEVLGAHPSQPDRALYDAIVRLDAAAVDKVASLGTVLWLGFESPRPILDDEMGDQIVAGNHPGGVPVPGYDDHLADLGVDGTGVVWAVIDSGVDYDHPDFTGRIVGGYSFPGIPGTCDTGTTPGNDCATVGGHGTHVAGILGGGGAAGFADLLGFRYGLGVAPGVGIFAMNSISGTAWPPAGGWQEHSKRAVLGGAVGGNNSWTTTEGAAHGYQASERTHDLMVRDGNFDTAAVAEPFIEVFSAGNSGPSSFTITAPHEAKNLITVGASRNFRVGSIDTLAIFSSRGPAVDGRWLPTVAAPGEQIASTRNDGGGVCAFPISGTSNLYAFCSGTSMAAPHASGAVALLVDWWRDFNAGANPSPAMAKALVVNGAVDMGFPDIPNIHEGWGRVNFSNVVAPAAPVLYWDQSTLFSTTGEELQLTLGVPDPNQPVKVTLAWSDAAGAVGANPALVNDLDLTVFDGVATYRGNRFAGGWSTAGGASDALNNLENVFLQNPTGDLRLTVAASAVNGDGVPYNGDATDQDFALVCSNCSLVSDFGLSVSPASRSLCAPANATYLVSISSILGFTDPVTLSASGQPAGTTVGFGNNPVVPAGATTLTVSNTGAATAGLYSLLIEGTSTTGTKSQSVSLDLSTAAPAPVSLLTPPSGATNLPLQPTLSWAAAGANAEYSLQVASDPGFTNLVATTSNLAATSFTLPTPLATSTTYFWRVRASNVCGAGSFSAARSFTTIPAPGDCGPGTTPTQLLAEGFEASTPGWTHSGVNDSWGVSSARAHGGGKSFFAANPGVISDQSLVSPAVLLPANALPLTLRFWHFRSIESVFDGAVIEISTNGGSSWTRLEAEILDDPYDGPVSTCCGNPLGGTNAWWGFQDWTRSMVNLSALAGQSVRFRFRLGTDSVVADEGWYIDDVTVTSCADRIFADGFESGNVSAWQALVPLIP